MGDGGEAASIVRRAEQRDHDGQPRAARAQQMVRRGDEHVRVVRAAEGAIALRIEEADVEVGELSVSEMRSWTRATWRWRESREADMSAAQIPE